MSLTVYKASAGSGKTFKLTEMFLRLLFRNTNNYRHILAVTFTNKATEEMKSRVIKELHLLAVKSESKYTDLFPEMSKDQLANIANESLTKILHDYSHFHISTIDSFFQRVIRSFLKEIGLDFGFEVELDTEKVLTEVTDKLMMQTGTNAQLDSWLVDFAEMKMEEGKSWNIEKEIKKLGYELFRETFKLKQPFMLEGLSDKNLLSSMRSDLLAEIRKFESEMSSIGKQALKIITENGLVVPDFKYGKAGVANYFNKIQDEEYEPGKRMLDAIDDGKQWYADKSVNTNKISAVFPMLNELLKRAVTFYNEKFVAYNSYKIILQNFSTLGIMMDLASELSIYKNEKSFFLLADSGDLLKHIIAESDAPFVYEKTGVGIAHFMIDEFQDTSSIQWKNFKPLLLNSISQNNECLLVGDVKQSIYRWRNSDWRILATEVMNDFPGQAVKEKHLELNWRSQGNVMRYNNSVFATASEILENHFNAQADEQTQIISQAYHDIVQKKKNDNKNGYIKVGFLKSENKEPFSELVLPQIPPIFEQLQTAGYALSDIAIIVRTAREGKEVADYLMAFQKNNPQSTFRYDVISDESIYLTNSVAVQFIESVLKHLTISDDVTRARLVLLYCKYIHPDSNQNIHENLSNPEFFRKNIQQPLDNANLLKKDFSLSELTEQVIMIFELYKLIDQLPYIQSFQDCVNDFSKRRNADLTTFIDWWTDERDGFTISICSEQNAARILTIHKSKGLEYKTIIVPYCNWELEHRANREIVWSPIPEADSMLSKYADKLKFIPLIYNSGMMNSYFRESYLTEKNQSYVDNLNLMYVAFTRACDNLFIFAPEPSKDKLSNAGDLLYKTLKEKISKADMLDLSTFWNEDKKEFECGEINFSDKKELSKIIPMPLMDYPVTAIKQRLRQKYSNKEYFLSSGDITQTPVNYGLLMHLVFSKIKSIATIDQLLKELMLQGKLDAKELPTFKKNITDKIDSDTMVQSWFSDDWDEVRTECDILLPNGIQYRPDRVMIKGNKAVVVDYKFGEVKEGKHDKQLIRYMSLLEEMNYKNVQGFVWYYLNETITEININ